MHNTKQSIPLAKIFKKSQRRIALFIGTICCGIFLVLTLWMLNTLVRQNAQLQLQHIQQQLSQNISSINKLHYYEQTLQHAIHQHLASNIQILDNKQQSKTVDAHMEITPNDWENLLNDVFFKTPLTLSFSNNLENGYIYYQISSKRYLFFYLMLFSAVAFIMLLIPIISIVLSYQLAAFLNHNVQPLVKAIHHFEKAKFTPLNAEYSYIHEFQIFSSAFNALLDKFESTKQNLNEQNTLLTHQAHHDVLTGLPNRQYFQDFINKKFHQNLNQQLVLLFIDNNKFKYINDTFGHQTGDAILIETAQRLKNNLDQDAFIARLGGDEFAVVLQRISSTQELENICQKLIDSCYEPLVFNDQNIDFSFSVGASYGYQAKNLDELLHQADLAMYEAKASPRKWGIYQAESFEQRLY